MAELGLLQCQDRCLSVLVRGSGFVFSSAPTLLSAKTHPWELILMLLVGFEGAEVALLVAKRRRGRTRQGSCPRTLLAWKRQVVSTR